MVEITAQAKQVRLGDLTVSEIDIVNALEEKEGSIAEAAEALGVKRHVLASAISSNEYLRNIHMDFLEAGIDAAQRVVFAAVKAGKLDAATFVLSTLGKDRGFSTKQELTLKKGGPDFNAMDEEALKAFILSDPDMVKALLECREQSAAC